MTIFVPYSLLPTPYSLFPLLLHHIPIVWARVGNATFTLISLIIIALSLGQAGWFRWLALHIANWGCGRGHLLFSLVILVGMLLSNVFTNVATTIVWTAAVMEILLLLGFSAKATLAFVFTSGFITDAASLLLPMSNPVNLIYVDYLQISWLRYVMVMLPVTIATIATSIIILWFYFEPQIPLTYNLARLPPPNRAIRDSLIFKLSFPILGLLLIGYLFAKVLNFPIAWIAAMAALVMVALAARSFNGRASRLSYILQLARQLPWRIILLILVLFLFSIGLDNLGITALLSQRLEILSNWGITLAASGSGFLATFIASVLNNLPTLLLNATAIENITDIDPAVKEVMIYGNLIGCNLGAKITPLGSLSTLLWLNVLAPRGLPISWVYYIRLTYILTMPILFVSLLSLAIWLPWLIA